MRLLSYLLRELKLQLLSNAPSATPHHPCWVWLLAGTWGHLWALFPTECVEEKKPILRSCSALRASTAPEFSTGEPHSICRRPLHRLHCSEKPRNFTSSQLTPLLLCWWKKWCSDFPIRRVRLPSRVISSVGGCLPFGNIHFFKIINDWIISGR